METNENEYEPGVDQNQGVVGTMARNQQHGGIETEGTEVPQLDPNLVTNQAETATEPDETAPDMTEIGEQTYLNDEGTD